jgi:hypothetical protein
MIDSNEVIIELCEGNPGAVSVLTRVRVARPDLLLYMYENGPRGSDIWVLYKDECGEDIFLFFDTLDLRRELEVITAEAADGR